MNSYGLSYFTSRFIGCCGPRKFGVGGLIQDFTISGLVDAAAEKFRVARRGSYALRNLSRATTSGPHQRQSFPSQKRAILFANSNERRQA